MKKTTTTLIYLNTFLFVLLILSQCRMNLHVRKSNLKFLCNFINSCRNTIKDIGDEFSWSMEDVHSEDQEMVQCPVVEGHRIPKSKLEDHVEACTWNVEGYTKEDIPLPDPPLGADESKTSIKLAQEDLDIIFKEAGISNYHSSKKYGEHFPKTADRYTAHFTPRERKAIYDYVIKKTSGPCSVQLDELMFKVEKKKDEGRPKTELELKIEERDAKRRRVSQRSKKVHTSRKTYSEVLREVIQNQMEVITEPAESGMNCDTNAANISVEIKKEIREQQTSKKNETSAIKKNSAEVQPVITYGYTFDDPIWTAVRKYSINPYDNIKMSALYAGYVRRGYTSSRDIESSGTSQRFHDSRSDIRNYNNEKDSRHILVEGKHREYGYKDRNSKHSQRDKYKREGEMESAYRNNRYLDYRHKRTHGNHDEDRYMNHDRKDKISKYSQRCVMDGQNDNKEKRSLKDMSRERSVDRNSAHSFVDRNRDYVKKIMKHKKKDSEYYRRKKSRESVHEKSSTSDQEKSSESSDEKSSEYSNNKQKRKISGSSSSESSSEKSHLNEQSTYIQENNPEYYQSKYSKAKRRKRLSQSEVESYKYKSYKDNNEASSSAHGYYEKKRLSKKHKRHKHSREAQAESDDSNESREKHKHRKHKKRKHHSRSNS